MAFADTYNQILILIDQMVKGSTSPINLPNQTFDPDHVPGEAERLANNLSLQLYLIIRNIVNLNEDNRADLIEEIKALNRELKAIDNSNEQSNPQLLEICRLVRILIDELTHDPQFVFLKRTEELAHLRLKLEEHVSFVQAVADLMTSSQRIRADIIKLESPPQKKSLISFFSKNNKVLASPTNTNSNAINNLDNFIKALTEVTTPEKWASFYDDYPEFTITVSGTFKHSWNIPSKLNELRTLIDITDERISRDQSEPAIVQQTIDKNILALYAEIIKSPVGALLKAELSINPAILKKLGEGDLARISSFKNNHVQSTEANVATYFATDERFKLLTTKIVADINNYIEKITPAPSPAQSPESQSRPRLR